MFTQSYKKKKQKMLHLIYILLKIKKPNPRKSKLWYATFLNL